MSSQQLDAVAELWPNGMTIPPTPQPAPQHRRDAVPRAADQLHGLAGKVGERPHLDLAVISLPRQCQRVGVARPGHRVLPGVECQPTGSLLEASGGQEQLPTNTLTVGALLQHQVTVVDARRGRLPQCPHRAGQ